MNSFPRLFRLSICCPYPVTAINSQTRSCRWQYSLGGTRAHASDLWTSFRGTTLLNSSLLLVERHVIRMTPSQSEFSLSEAFASAQEPVIPPGFLTAREREPSVF